MTPWERIESERPDVASWSKRLRGWRGFAWMSSIGTCASSGVRPPIRTSSQRPQGGRGVEQPEMEAVIGCKSLSEEPIAAVMARELHRSAGQLRLRGNEKEIRKRGRLRKLGQRRAVEQVVARSPVCSHAEPR